MHIDLIISQLDGDPLDICSIATFIALKSTRIPKIETIIGESGRPDDFQVCGDIDIALPLQTNDIPICITIVKVGEVLVMDATSAEHASADYAFAISIDSNNGLCSFFKLHGHGSVTIPELSDIIEVRYNLRLCTIEIVGVCNICDVTHNFL